MVLLLNNDNVIYIEFSNIIRHNYIIKTVSKLSKAFDKFSIVQTGLLEHVLRHDCPMEHVLESRRGPLVYVGVFVELAHDVLAFSGRVIESEIVLLFQT